MSGERKLRAKAGSDRPGAVSLSWAGETLMLLPGRAISWKRRRTLFIADPHFGKAAAFRFAGIPIPETAHDDDLARLDELLRVTAARHLVILGDFFHAKTGRSETTLAALDAWRVRHKALAITLVLGNHDRHAGCPPDDWRIECKTGPWPMPPFLCCHEPAEIDDAFVLAGHLHPAFRLPGNMGASGRCPCFHFGERVAVLPAFGSFTGMHRIDAARGDRVFAAGDGEIIEVPLSPRGMPGTRS